MTFKQRMVLLCAVCIVLSGLLVSYKSFQLQQDLVSESDIAHDQEVSQWVATGIDQKISQVEASVSYLDKSTVESLKRFGVRFFAYAFKKDNDWSIKWKKLGEMGKEAILSEVNELEFAQLPTTQRSWHLALEKNILLVSPVGLAESHQLKTGFLIFGLKPEFFGFIGGNNSQYSLVSSNSLRLFGEAELEEPDLEALISKDSVGRNQLISGDSRFTSHFSKLSQVWVIGTHQVQAASFIASRFFIYFVFGSLISIMIFCLFALRVLKSTEPEILKKTSDDLNLEPIEEAPLAELRVIGNFDAFIEQVLDAERPRLEAVGVDIKTQIEEAAEIFCTPEHVRDFIVRLIGNSVLSLENAKEKQIQIQLVEQRNSYQLIYVDTREDFFPSGHEASVFLQNEASLEGIDGIISYASWLFGDGLTVAKKGFCLSIDLAKAVAKTVVEPEVVAENWADSVERVEIKDEDLDQELFTELRPSITSDEDSDEPSVNFDDVVEQFRMKEFSFNEATTVAETTDAAQTTEAIEETESIEDDQGMVELKSENFKLKIRSPRKNDEGIHG